MDKDTNQPSRIFVARNRLDLALINSIRNQSGRKYFDILITVREGQYPEIDLTFSEPSKFKSLSKTFGIVIDLNEILFPIHPLRYQPNNQFHVFISVFRHVFSNKEIVDIVAPDYKQPYMSMLCNLVPEAELSLYFDRLSTISLFSHNELVSKLHRIKFVYGFSCFEEFLKPLANICNAEFKSISIDLFRNFILNTSVLGNTNLSDHHIIVNVATDTYPESFSRKNKISVCQNMLSLANSLSDSSHTVLRVHQQFDELDLLTLKKWYLKTYQRELSILGSEKCFLSHLLLLENGIVLGHGSFELIAARELTNFPVIAVPQIEYARSETKTGELQDRITDLIFHRLFPSTVIDLESATFPLLKEISNSQRSTKNDVSSSKDIVAHLEVLLFFAGPEFYGYLGDKVGAYLETCSKDVFSKLLPEPYFVQQKISSTANSWSKMLRIQKSFLKTEFEYKHGDSEIAELACRYHLERKESPARIALLAKILYGSNRRKAAFRTLFYRETSRVKGHSYFSQFYVLGKFITYFFSR